MNKEIEPQTDYEKAFMSFLKLIKIQQENFIKTYRNKREKALAYHSDGYTEGDITVQVCWDADRLDLGRVGINQSQAGSVLKLPNRSTFLMRLIRDPLSMDIT